MACTCVKYVLRTTESSYVEYFNGGYDACFSKVGRLPGKPNRVSLGDGCYRNNTILHENLHALGFDHMQSRPDRDKYITINWSKVFKGLENQFDIANIKSMQVGSFDFESVMLYGSTLGSVDESIVIVPKIEGVTIPPVNERGFLSKGDIEKINLLYDCPPTKCT